MCVCVCVQVCVSWCVCHGVSVYVHLSFCECVHMLWCVCMCVCVCVCVSVVVFVVRFVQTTACMCITKHEPDVTPTPSNTRVCKLSGYCMHQRSRTILLPHTFGTIVRGTQAPFCLSFGLGLDFDFDYKE